MKYYTWESLPTSKETGLGDVTTKEANAAVEIVLEQERNGAEGRKRKCTHFTSEQRAKIGRCADESGNVSALRHFSKVFPSLEMLQTLVNIWKCYIIHNTCNCIPVLYLPYCKKRIVLITFTL